jgi:phage tail sheath protein FI
VPPSGHIAGVYARVEALVGPHKPPANEVLDAALDVTVAVDDLIHGRLNDGQVNVLRAYAGRGLRVAGARTLSSESEWRYVNVRRLMLMIERSLEAGTQWLVFEPNNPALWRDFERVLRGFLDDLWRRGMLDGATAAQAYSVACDISTNPPAETDAGRLIAVIGVQPPWPAEFVVARIGKTENGIQVMEGRGA